MSHPTIHPWRLATASLSLMAIAGACGPVPTYARLGASGQEPDAGGLRDAGSGGASTADDGGTPSGGVGALGGHAGGGAMGTGGRMDAGSDGMGSGGVNPATGGSPVATGGSPVATGGSPVATGGAASGGTGGVIVGSGGSPAGTGGADKGGRGGGGGGTADGGAMGPADLSHYAFEGSVQGWTMAGGSSSWSRIECSTAASFAGTGSLAGTVSARAGVAYILEIEPPTPAIPAGATVSFHLRVPPAAMLTAVQPYVMETGTFRFTGTRIGGSDLARNTWVKVDVNVPKDAASILRIGVQFESSGTWSDTIYLDAIDW